MLGACVLIIFTTLRHACVSLAQSKGSAVRGPRHHRRSITYPPCKDQEGTMNPYNYHRRTTETPPRHHGHTIKYPRSDLGRTMRHTPYHTLVEINMFSPAELFFNAKKLSLPCFVLLFSNVSTLLASYDRHTSKKTSTLENPSSGAFLVGSWCPCEASTLLPS